ncbi:MAG: 3'-5' exonuclease [Bacteroidales bacterium]|nr:3'-5' exonuclease [Bacteroidales bacterium]MDT8432950.1 3'-5' exonuclease [Bacteroidales bacterium]
MRLTNDQIKIAEFDLPGAYAIKGVAGSGKSSIGLHRASYLVKERCPEPDDSVLILTYNRSLLKYLDFQYQKIRESVPRQLSLVESNDHLAGERLQIDTIGQKQNDNYKRYKELHALNSSTLFFSDEEKARRKKIFSDAIRKTAKQFPVTSLLNEDQHGFLYEEIRWIKVCMFWIEKDYLEADRRLFDASSEYGTHIPKGSSSRKAIYALYRNFRDLLRENELHDFPDTEAMGYEQARQSPVEQFTHIIVDESQDLTRLQLSFLRLILKNKPYATITFLYDISQSIYPVSWLGMNHPFSSVGFDVTGSRTRYLRRNYRTSNEILSAARNMMSAEPVWQDNEPFYCNQSGLRPIHTHCSDRKEQDEELVKLILNLDEKFKLEDVAITCRFNSDLERIGDKLREAGIESEKIDRNTKQYNKESVKLLTFHSFKGLESDVVIIPELNDDHFPYFPPGKEDDEEQAFQERKLLYVAMTRATRMLFMFSYGTTTSFVQDISPDLIRNVDLDEPRVKESFIYESYTIAKEPLESCSSSWKIKEPGSQLSLFEESKKHVDDLRKRFFEQDKKQKSEDNTLSSLLEAMANNLNIKKVETEDTTTLLEAIMEEVDNKSQENQQLAEQVSKLVAEKKLLREHSITITPLQVWISTLKEKYPKLNGQQIQSLAEAELLREMVEQTEIDCSTPYTVYTRVMESIMKKGIRKYDLEIPEDKRPTFGVLFYEFMKEPDWFRVLEPMDMAKVVEIRNQATHASRKVSTEELITLHHMLIKENALGRMIELSYG